MRWLRILAVRLLIAVLVFEALLRVYSPLPFRLRGDAIVLPAGVRYIRTNQPGTKLDPVTVHTRHRLGFRGSDLPADFASRFSIIAVGGSTTECFLLSDGKTWPDRMAAAPAAVRPDVWVNNAGLDGHSTFGHLVLLRSVLTTLKPTMVLFLIGVNDVGLEQVGPYDEFPESDPSAQRFWPAWRATRRSSILASTWCGPGAPPRPCSATSRPISRRRAT